MKANALVKLKFIAIAILASSVLILCGVFFVRIYQDSPFQKYSSDMQRMNNKLIGQDWDTRTYYKKAPKK